MTEFSIPVGEMRCAVCEKSLGEESGEFVGIVYAGDAWENGYAELKEGAHLYTVRVFCAEHAPPEGQPLDA